MGCANSKIEAVAGSAMKAANIPAGHDKTTGDTPPASPAPRQQEVHAHGVPPAPASSRLENSSEVIQAAECAASAAQQQASSEAPECHVAADEAAALYTPALADATAVEPAGVEGNEIFDPNGKDFIGAPLLAEDGSRCEANACLFPEGFPSPTEQEPRFDPITKLMASIFKMPHAMVVFIDGAYCSTKSVTGMEAAAVNRHMSFCTWTLVSLKPEMLVVHDATKDGRFRSHPYVVGAPHVRFYAGAPLVTSTGNRLGTLCLLDYQPREFDAECCNILANFAEMVVRDAERYAKQDSQVQRSLSLAMESKELIRAIDKSSDAYILCSPHEPGWPMLFINDAWGSATDLDGVRDTGRAFWDCFEVRGAADGSIEAERPWAAQEESVARGASFMIQVVRRGSEPGAELYMIVFRPAAHEKLDKNMSNINIPAITKKASDQTPTAYYFGCIRRIRSNSSGPTDGTLEDEETVPFEDVVLGALLGKGSYGNVYFGCWQLPTGEEIEVAVKLIEHKSKATELEAIHTEMEATLGLQLQHPNVVRTYKYTTRLVDTSWDSMSAWKTETASIAAGSRASAGRHGSGGSQVAGSLSKGLTNDSSSRYETWILLELCSLGSLQGAIDGGAFRVTGSVYDGLPDLHTILLVAAEIASAFQYLHSKNVLHGDLTANNILMVETPETELLSFSAKVSDFGLSRVVLTETAIKTNTCGTVTHMPPELISEGKMSKAVDVYGFGVLLWELYVGERPYAGMRPVQIIMRKSQGNSRLLFPPGTPVGYKELAESCMASSPGDRPTFSAIVEDLYTLLEAFDAGNVQPQEPFALYQDWGACGTLP